MSDGLQFGFSGDAAEIAVRWLQSLKSERRMAAKTLEAFDFRFRLRSETDDVARYLDDDEGHPNRPRDHGDHALYLHP